MKSAGIRGLVWEAFCNVAGTTWDFWNNILVVKTHNNLGAQDHLPFMS
jgi:hypothetical protein